ncbi:MAG: hypothetical protein Q7U68_05545, partial [Candidatus Roizmanbacteria bacterium]|nr:hypothetical protein [Candidatus Roizmanbacteria bacterium]
MKDNKICFSRTLSYLVVLVVVVLGTVVVMNKVNEQKISQKSQAGELNILDHNKCKSKAKDVNAFCARNGNCGQYAKPIRSLINYDCDKNVFKVGRCCTPNISKSWLPTPTLKRMLTSTMMLTPTMNPKNLRLEVLAVTMNGEYNGNAHIDFYDGSVKKYYGFFYAFAGDQTSTCSLDGYKIISIGKEILITELIPNFYLKSERTNDGVKLYFLYQQKKYDLFMMAKNANHILVGIDNTRI